MDRERNRGSRRDPGVTRAGPRRRSLRSRLPRTLRATRAGWCFIAIIFGVGFAALNTGNNLLYLVLALLLAFLVLSGLLSEASLRGMRVERRLPPELFARSPQRMSLRIHNDQKRHPSFAVSIEDRIVGSAGDESIGRAFVLRVGPGLAIHRSYLFEPPHRGELVFSSVRLSTRFPFGLFVKSVELPLEATTLVYPARCESSTPHGAPRSPRDGDAPGDTRLEGDAIGGVREYAKGDSMHRVHWRRTLRERRLIVGERESQSAAEIEILLRLPESLSEAEIEDRVSRAATEVARHLESGDRVGLRTLETRFEPGTGAVHRRTLLSHLARIGREPAQAKSPHGVAGALR